MAYEKIIPHFTSLSKFTLKINSDFLLYTYFWSGTQIFPYIYENPYEYISKFCILHFQNISNISLIYPKFFPEL